MEKAWTERMSGGTGFVAALDQSGGSTPKALAMYGVPESAYSSDQEMFDLMHEFRSRLITAPGFTGERILGAILFEQTMDRDIEGTPAPRYLWEQKSVVPFVKVDEGLAPEADGVRLMKPFTKLPAVLERAVERQVFGTKMRSFISRADAGGIAAILDQQFAYARQILDAGLVPILEPEVDIESPEKARSEQLLKQGFIDRLGDVPDGQRVMLKLSIPTEDDLYLDLIRHPKVLRVVALSGGYSREEAVTRLARNHRLIASFSRAFTEGLERDQDDEVFDRILDTSIAEIYAASTT
ncbi:class I fructose-bisphosphate aldolase [Asanoa ishikariensis]|uniref:fructose-bisphosphate aldolase n=1 Tax=Asanoa ishikariensis TaxID=137265 RepID=A0A1H3UM16_9ACTN|nr:fructose bisphosphate aldolase [Asanoa ishikariensis]GIF69936.1 class I fructose-bisphosphate aldolase [Asanoa ishikariensis]SDZ63460.1 fructose-bisphosphate aldolase [Asanoa ishikariensis]